MEEIQDFTIIDENKIIDVVMTAGRILLESGAETYRVEDTMARIATSYGLENTHSFVTSTAIIFSLNDRTNTRLIRIDERTTDLEKISLTNQISRKISNNELTIDEAKSELIHLHHASLQFPFWLKVLAAAIASACFLPMFGGKQAEVIPSFIAGGVGYLTMSLVHNTIRIKFFTEFISSLIIATIATISVNFFIGVNLSLITIASVMPLVPGVLITNAIRDLMAGQLLAGISKGVEAALTAFAIGAGVAIVLLLS